MNGDCSSRRALNSSAVIAMPFPFATTAPDFFGAFCGELLPSLLGLVIAGVFALYAAKHIREGGAGLVVAMGAMLGAKAIVIAIALSIALYAVVALMHSRVYPGRRGPPPLLPTRIALFAIPIAIAARYIAS